MFYLAQYLSQIKHVTGTYLAKNPQNRHNGDGEEPKAKQMIRDTKRGTNAHATVGVLTKSRPK